MANFETTSCPICGSDNHDLVVTAPDRFDLPRGDYLSLVQCKQCSLGFLNPRPTPDSIGNYYRSADYQPFLSARSTRNTWDQLYRLTRALLIKRKRIKITAVKSKGSLLDVGCGTGEFLNEMNSNGWDVAGVEKDSGAVDFARQKYGLAVTLGEIEDSDHQPASFDVITFWHVLEHVFDPVSVLNRVQALLKSGGFLLVAAPNFSSLDANFYGRDWVALDAPRHLLHFTPVSMRQLCAASGLELAGHYQMVMDAFYNCLLSEKLTANRNGASGLAAVPGYFRGLSVAARSVASASRFGEKKLGSSVLYIIRKANS